MGRKGDSGGSARRLIDKEAKACFLAGLRAGATRSEAGRRAGFSYQSFYGARQRDPVFKLGWIWALELSAADERAAFRPPSLAAADAAEPPRPALPESRSRRTTSAGCRRGGCDARASPRRARRSSSTISRSPPTPSPPPRRPGFIFRPSTGIAAATPISPRDWDEALRHAFALLEAEAVRQRLEAQQRLRESPDPTGEMPEEFERVMKLLARKDRRDGRIGNARGELRPAEALDIRGGDPPRSTRSCARSAFATA